MPIDRAGVSVQMSKWITNANTIWAPCLWYIIKCFYETMRCTQALCVLVAAAAVAAVVCCFSSVSFSLFSSSSFRVYRERALLYVNAQQFSWGLLKVSYRMLGHKTISCSTACFRVTRFSPYHERMPFWSFLLFNCFFRLFSERNWLPEFHQIIIEFPYVQVSANVFYFSIVLYLV